jgi:UDP-N-acetylmuramate: L-alanyl-gamma-D-glutamyl-meso-diaminopimelate ligase
VSKHQHIHILGICGTFMGGVAVLARQLGYRVTGCDQSVYPPMSTFLESQGIEIIQGYGAEQLDLNPDMLVVGNAMKRGMPVIEAMLNRSLPYISGPQWLAENVLQNKWVLAVAGTHGKTTTSSLLAHILTYAGLKPGFLIGGIAEDFGVSARIGEAPFFVVEADEYDSAFFDKRSKFVHYHPRTLICNNLEFDHADIFDTVADIQKQFHHVIRTVPSEGLIVENSTAPYLQETLAKGCWTPRQSFAGDNSDWTSRLIKADGSEFEVSFKGQAQGHVQWKTLGLHNVHNALAAIAAAHHAGVPVAVALEAIHTFKGVKRRLELRGEVKGVRVYDDFAHHPTAIRVTLQGIRDHVSHQGGRLIAVLEPRSNTMRMGVFGTQLRDALQIADYIALFEPAGLNWNTDAMMSGSTQAFKVAPTLEELVANVRQYAKAGDHVVVMSNGGFGGVHQKLLDAFK